MWFVVVFSMGLVVYCCPEERNSRGVDRLFVHNHHQLYPSLKALYEDPSQGEGGEVRNSREGEGNPYTPALP